MDENLIKYRFGITLELYQSCYGFGTNASPPEFVFSTCFITPAWFYLNGHPLTMVAKNTWIVTDMATLSLIRNHLASYYIATSNKCAPFL